MSDTTSGGILPSSAAKAQVVDGEAPVIGSIEQNGFSLEIEEDAFPGGGDGCIRRTGFTGFDIRVSESGRLSADLHARDDRM